MSSGRSFASDNNAGVHPEVLHALATANRGHVVGYGDDPHTRSMELRFREHFGAGAAVFPVFNGTAANVLCLKALTQSHQAVICSEASHIQVDECGAPEAWTGCKLLPVATPDGKLTPRRVEAACHGVGDQHHVQPRVLSIAQSTELGTVYRPNEVAALARFAHARGMVLHMDGARISNAAAALGLSLRQATRDLGVDALSFGGTKNGLLGADAVVLFRKELVPEFKYLRKQGMQLASKMRFLSVQLEALLTRDLWRRNALQANRMAKRLKSLVRRIRGVRIVQKVDANGVFVEIPRRAIAPLRRKTFFYTWDEAASVVRWMCSWDTTEDDVRDFARAVSQALR
ncbi:MAG TPA: low specificity L-threonine aldolase [Planctomycetota bacterium]|nr:low specificity L-threonine aldolase [Planctomycetota bacterium]